MEQDSRQQDWWRKGNTKASGRNRQGSFKDKPSQVHVSLRRQRFQGVAALVTRPLQVWCRHERCGKLLGHAMGARKCAEKESSLSWARCCDGLFHLPSSHVPRRVFCAREQVGCVGRTSAGHYYSRRRSYYAVWVGCGWCADTSHSRRLRMPARTPVLSVTPVLRHSERATIEAISA